MKHIHSKKIRTIALLILIVMFTFTVGYQQAQARATFPLRVPANIEWVSTGIFIDPASVPLEVNIHTTGQAITGPINSFGRGSKSGPGGQETICTSIPDLACALEGAPYGMLIGKMGSTGQAFPIGNASSFTITEPGFLYLTVNDYLGTYNDNKGGFDVLIEFK